MGDWRHGGKSGGLKGTTQPWMKSRVRNRIQENGKDTTKNYSLFSLRQGAPRGKGAHRLPCKGGRSSAKRELHLHRAANRGGMKLKPVKKGGHSNLGKKTNGKIAETIRSPSLRIRMHHVAGIGGERRSFNFKREARTCGKGRDLPATSNILLSEAEERRGHYAEGKTRKSGALYRSHVIRVNIQVSIERLAGGGGLTGEKDEGGSNGLAKRITIMTTGNCYLLCKTVDWRKDCKKKGTRWRTKKGTANSATFSTVRHGMRKNWDTEEADCEARGKDCKGDVY